MSSRGRWAVAAAGLVVVIGLVALFVFNATLSSGTDRPPKTWLVQPGETLRLSSDQVLPEDQYECPGRPGTVVGTPRPGSFASAQGGIRVSTNDGGTVQVSCEASPD